MHDYLLAHDLGTSGDKAVLFDATTREIISSVVQPYETYYVENGGVEHDSETWWEAVCVSTRRLLESTGVRAQQIRSVSFSAIMNSCLPIDGEGNPLRRAMIWCDQRGASALARIRQFTSDDDFYAMTGHKLNSTYAIAKMLWFKQSAPELFQKTAYFLQAKDYIVFKLTGKIATDFSDASHLGLMDQARRTYWNDLLDAVDIPPSVLPPLHKSTDVIGYVTPKAASASGLTEGTPVIIGGGDGCCANVGAGLYRPGAAYNILGTSSWHGTLSERMLMSKATASFIHLDGVQHAALGTMQSAGHSLNWLLDFLNPSKDMKAKEEIFFKMNASLEKKIRGGKLQQLIYMPYLLGERSPWWNANARGCFIGLDASTTQDDAILACLEGVAFNLKVILDDMESKLGSLNMRIIGGGARNEQWVKILASVWNKELEIPKYITEATSLGAILCAGIGVGAFSSFSDIEYINPTVDRISPSAGLQDRYHHLYPVFKNAYMALVDTFDELRIS